MELSFKKILVPIDFSTSSYNALSYAVEFGKVFSSEIFLIHVVETLLYPPDFSMGIVTLPTFTADINQHAEEELKKSCEKYIGDLLPSKCIVRAGKPFIEICNIAEEEKIDLIIISSHGNSGVEHILFGSTAEKVVRKAPCPVLTLKSK